MEIFALIVVGFAALVATMFIGPHLAKINNRFLFQISVIIVFILILGVTYVVLLAINAPIAITNGMMGGLIAGATSNAVYAGIEYGMKHPKKPSTD